MATFQGRSPSPHPPDEDGSKVNTKVKETQQQVQEITDIMRMNMQNLVEREVKLTELDRRAENLNENAKLFDKTTKKLERTYRWKSMKWTIIFGVFGTVIVLIIAVSIFFSFL